MNMNPWYLERTLEYERERIRRDMKQIRLEEEAIQAQASHIEEKRKKAPIYGPRLLMWIVPTLIKLKFCVDR
ncbi:MAG TPA: hypothetical protein VFY83_15040 [Anaerolineales bacterium]|nr:hypothetical protein [Anaerolineales bacterium]